MRLTENLLLMHCRQTGSMLDLSITIPNPSFLSRLPGMQRLHCGSDRVSLPNILLGSLFESADVCGKYTQIAHIFLYQWFHFSHLHPSKMALQPSSQKICLVRLPESLPRTDVEKDMTGIYLISLAKVDHRDSRH